MTGERDEPDYRDLVEEFRSLTLGPLWINEVQRAIAITTPRYPPAVYAEGGAWTHASKLDLAQDVIADQLLAAGQLAYVLDAATNLDQARALMMRVVRRTLANRRTRTVIDNLLRRCRELEPDIARNVTSGGVDATDDELKRAAIATGDLPRIKVRGGDRAPQVYSTEVLHEILAICSQVLHRPCTQRELAKIFELSLTDLLPGALVFYDGEYDQPDQVLTGEEEVIMQEALEHVLEALPPIGRTVMGLKLASWSDTAIAEVVGKSRPSVADVRARASTHIQDIARGLEGPVQDRFVEGLASRLLAEVHSLIRDQTATEGP